MAVSCYTVSMKKRIKGQFQKGIHYSESTEFKKGQHWRKPQPFWDKDYLLNQYHTMQKSASEIAADHECKENNILYWLKKHGIPRRSMKEVRKRKHWGLVGPANGMYGRIGEDNPHWQGGITPERQALYASQEWAKVVKEVWKRDNARCQRCQELKSAQVEFHIHHIKGFACVELRTVLSNLVLLCRGCHNFVHSKANTAREFICE